MNKLIIGLLFMGFALPSFSQQSIDTLLIKKETLIIEKIVYGKDTLTSVRKIGDDYFSVDVIRGEVISLFSSREYENTYISYTVFRNSQSYHIVHGGEDFYFHDADKGEIREIKKRIKQIEKEYLKYIQSYL